MDTIESHIDRQKGCEHLFKEDLRQALAVLRAGGIILYPTDTVWGLGCDATNPAAVEKIYKLKRRAESKSMLVLVADEAQAERFTEDAEEIAFTLMTESVSPLTVIFDKGFGLADNLTADDGSIGIRMTREPFTKALCRTLRRPLVSTSANISGAPSAAIFSEISDEIINGVDYVVNYRRDDRRRHRPSAIIKVSHGGVIKIIRE